MWAASLAKAWLTLTAVVVLDVEHWPMTADDKAPNLTQVHLHIRHGRNMCLSVGLLHTHLELFAWFALTGGCF